MRAFRQWTRFALKQWVGETRDNASFAELRHRRATGLLSLTRLPAA